MSLFKKKNVLSDVPGRVGAKEMMGGAGVGQGGRLMHARHPWGSDGVWGVRLACTHCGGEGEGNTHSTPAARRHSHRPQSQHRCWDAAHSFTEEHIMGLGSAGFISRAVRTPHHHPHHLHHIQTNAQVYKHLLGFRIQPPTQQMEKLSEIALFLGIKITENTEKLQRTASF